MTYIETFDDLVDPIGGKVTVVLLFFALCLLALDLVFVRRLDLSKLTWKRFDYVWLTLTAIGLVGSTVQVRTATASSLLARYQVRAHTSMDAISANVNMTAMASEGYVDVDRICLRKLRVGPSPPLVLDREHELACEWLQKYAALIADAGKSSSDKLPEVSKLPLRPVFSDRGLIEYFAKLDRLTDRFAEERNEWHVAEDRAQPSEFERQLATLSPFLLAFALALRITKVTGEIRLERILP